MPLTKVQVVSNTLNLLGKASIMNIVNQSDLANAASNWFDFLLSVQMGTGTWRFATTIATLAKLNETPVGGYWLFSYLLPANFRKLIHLWPQFYDYEIYKSNRLYTNFDNTTQPLNIEHQFVPEIETVPDYFWDYFIFEIADRLSLSNAQNVQYKAALAQDKMTARAVALAADAQNRPQTPLQSAPMIANRFVSTFASG